MIAALARRAGPRAAAAAIAVLLGAASMMLGAGTANAAPRQVVCTIGTALPAPVTVTEGERVQLVLDVPVLGIRVNVGPAQTATTPGEQVLSATVTGVVGLVGQLCKAVVQVQTAVTSAVPLPPLPQLPSAPPLLPTQSVQVPLPGAEVSVQTGGTGSAPGTGNPAPNQPGAPPPATGSDAPSNDTAGAPSGLAPTYRFDAGRIPLYDFSSAPYGVSTRFGAAAAPAFRFGQRVPGYAPQFGILGGEDVTTAGQVQTLPLHGPTAVGLPVLLAVLMLSTVSGALVRTWTLSRST